MAQYRRKLNQGKQKYVNDRYKTHKDAKAGIFTSDKRRKLLGIKPKGRDVSPENLANFWYDVRTSVTKGLADLHLVSEVAHEDQMKEMFQPHPYQAIKEDPSLSSLATLVSSVLESPDGSSKFIVSRRRKPSMLKEQPDAWKAVLAQEIVKHCLGFFSNHGFVTSKAHQRVVDELNDMISSEISKAFFMERGLRNIYF